MHRGWYDRQIQRVRDLSCGVWHIYLELEVRRVACRSCNRVKRERLSFLADNPAYTKRFAYYVGRRCRQGTVKDVAEELRLDWPLPPVRIGPSCDQGGSDQGHSCFLTTIRSAAMSTPRMASMITAITAT